MNDTEKWILEWFKEQNSTTLNGEMDELINGNYFEKGWIDSLGILTLIDLIESEFEIMLTHEHFEQRRFSTIKGLAEIIDEETSS